MWTKRKKPTHPLLVPLLNGEVLFVSLQVVGRDAYPLRRLGHVPNLDFRLILASF